jgi:type II secretory ATPase GspE/PulE/Tfp pilus assembly ATPase PilB-like protein
LAQRLVRKICPDCKEKYSPSKEMLKDLNLKPDEKTEFYRGKGCPNCMTTGYRGRLAIYELVLPDEKIRNAVMAKASSDDIRKLAIAGGMTTLMEDGIGKIRQGVTTVEEVLRVTRED